MPKQVSILTRPVIVTRLFAGFIMLASLALFASFVTPSGPPTQAQTAVTTAATTIGANCASCHRAYVQSFALEIHGKTAKFLSDSRAATCEACHGDSTKHIENREKRIAADDIDMPTELKTKEARARANEKCLICHLRDRTRFQWAGGEHDRGDMSCMSCHNVHHNKFPGGVLANRERSVIDGPP